MKRKCYLPVCLLILSSIYNLSAQTVPDTVFTKLYKYGKLHAYAELVVEANNGGLIVVVNANDTKTTDTSVIYLHKVDENGQKEWTAQIAAEDSALWPYSIVQTHEKDGYIITGVTVDMESYSYDYFILRTSNTGDVIWKNVYGIEDYDDIAMDVIKTDDENYLVLGGTQDAEPEPGWHLKFFTRKINGSGTTIWYKTYGNNENYSTPCKIAKTSNGYLLAGYSLYNESYAFLIKLNANGDSLFTKTFPADTFKHTWIHDIAVAGNGDFFLIGNVTNTISPELYDIVLMRLDADCNLKWTRTYNPFLGFGEVGKRICIGDNSSLYLAGSCNIDKLAAVSDIFIMKTDTAGNEIWKKELTDYETTSLSDMLKTEEDIYICGTIDIRVETFPFLTKFKVENSNTGFAPVINLSEIFITNSRDNSVSIFILPLEQSNAVIEIFDLAGHKVYSTQTALLSDDHPNEIKIYGLKDGLYICRCAIGNEIIVEKFLVFR